MSPVDAPVRDRERVRGRERDDHARARRTRRIGERAAPPTDGARDLELDRLRRGLHDAYATIDALSDAVEILKRGARSLREENAELRRELAAHRDRLVPGDPSRPVAAPAHGLDEPAGAARRSVVRR